MGKPLKIEIDGRVMSLKEAVLHLVSSGCDNDEIYRRVCAHSGYSRKSLDSEISKARRDLKDGFDLSRISVDVTAETKANFEREAQSRGVAISRLASAALRIIAADNLFEAVLGDALPAKKKGRGA